MDAVPLCDSGRHSWCPSIGKELCRRGVMAIQEQGGRVGFFSFGGSELGAEDRVLSGAPLAIPRLLSRQPRVGLVSGAQLGCPSLLPCSSGEAASAARRSELDAEGAECLGHNNQAREHLFLEGFSKTLPCPSARLLRAVTQPIGLWGAGGDVRTNS